jgi:hypothetical protein
MARCCSRRCERSVTGEDRSFGSFGSFWSFGSEEGSGAGHLLSQTVFVERHCPRAYRIGGGCCRWPSSSLGLRPCAGRFAAWVLWAPGSSKGISARLGEAFVGRRAARCRRGNGLRRTGVLDRIRSPAVAPKPHRMSPGGGGGHTPMFLGSSTAEHPAVNRRVAGSNPARGAKLQVRSVALGLSIHVPGRRQHSLRPDRAP